MAELKTKKNDASVEGFIGSIQDADRREGARALVRIMRRITGDKPKMWGTAIVGFGSYHYRYGTGREADWPLVGFSPRAQALTVYLPAGFRRLQPLLKKLGKHSTGSSCLHIRRMSEVDPEVLEAIVAQGVVEAKALDRPQTAAKTPAKRKASPKGKKAPAARRARASA